jgi:predicted dinucleotide-binding enzyme
MNVGVIGSGHIGATVARKLVAAGHDVQMANSRGPETLDALAREIGARAVTPEEAAEFGDLVVEAVPLHAYDKLPADALKGKVVIDAANYYPGRDGNIAELEDGELTSSELVARHLAGARVVKAFNTIYWEHIRDKGRPAGDPERLAIPIAGDDAEAKKLVSDLIDEFGFDPVDGGRLADSYRQQPGAPVYGEPGNADAIREALAAA